MDEYINLYIHKDKNLSKARRNRNIIIQTVRVFSHNVVAISEIKFEFFKYLFFKEWKISTVVI